MAETYTGIKGVLRELFSYKSGIFGIFFLLLLVGISAYTVIAIPYDRAVSLWRGEQGVYIENPRNAQPVWINYLGYNLPENIVLDSRNEDVLGVTKLQTPVSGTEIKLVRTVFSFQYNYDALPSEMNIFFYSEYNESAPLQKIFWVKPDGTEINLIDYIVKGKRDQLYLSSNQEIETDLNDWYQTIYGPKDRRYKTLSILFGDLDSLTQNPDPVEGTYKLIIEGTLFSQEAQTDARMVLYGKVHGVAGTDHLRRDLIVGILWGTPVALAFGITASLTISLVQLILATISGYYGGRVDNFIQRITELYMILPFLPILIMIAAFYKLDIWVLLVVIIILSVFGPGVKSNRALVLQIKEYPYIEAAKAYGASNARIVFFYIIPKILPPIVPNLIAAVPSYVFLEAALAFLGLGDPLLPTWGKIINDSFTEGALYKGYYYWVLEPAMMLVLTAFAFSFLGFALDKIINPKLKEV